ncbi:MAG: hypothetical protein AB3N20_12715 [Rhizobiaceae bacterium]
MMNSTTSKTIRAIVLTAILTGSTLSPVIARDGGGDGPRQTLYESCDLQKKLDKAETRVTALQFEYRSLSRDLEKAEKGSKEEAKLQRRLKKVSKRLGKERDKAAEYFRQISERQYNGIGC